MMRCVLIGLWTLFSWYVMECKLFGMCIVSKGAKKIQFPINLNLNQQGSHEGHKPLDLSNEPKISG